MLATKSEEIAIVAMETQGEIVDVGKETAKRMPPGSRHRYLQTVIYTISDGRQITGIAKGETKPKLAKEIESKQSLISKGGLLALFQDGQFAYTIMRISISLL